MACELHWVRMKLLFTATITDETMVAIDAIMGADHAVLKARGQCTVMCCNECNNKCYKGANRHDGFVPVILKTVSTDDYSDVDSAALFRRTTNATFALLHHTFAALSH